MVSAATRVTGDLQAAEECAQDACVLALGAWARDGIPDRPGAWLVVAACRRALDVVRRAQVLAGKLALLAEPEGVMGPDENLDDIADDRLRLVFTCCRPALALPTRAALTLRTVCGVSTADVARAFLVSEPTMAARLTRARKKSGAGPSGPGGAGPGCARAARAVPAAGAGGPHTARSGRA